MAKHAQAMSMQRRVGAFGEDLVAEHAAGEADGVNVKTMRMSCSHVRPGLGKLCVELGRQVSGGHAEAVAALVTRGADVSLRDKLWNGTPADWAAHAGHADLAQTLREAERPS